MSSRTLLLGVLLATLAAGATLLTLSQAAPVQFAVSDERPTHVSRLDSELAAVRSDLESIRGVDLETSGLDARLRQLEVRVSLLAGAQSRLVEELGDRAPAQPPSRQAAAEAPSDFDPGAVPQPEDDPLLVEREAAEALFADEPFDGGWATGAERALNELSHLESVTSAQATCQSTLCRLDLEVDKEALPEVFDSLPWPGEALFEVHPDGRAQIWIPREGYALPLDG